jgi:hypothetical protein
LEPWLSELETMAEAELEAQNDLAPNGTVAAGPLVELAAVEVEQLPQIEPLIEPSSKILSDEMNTYSSDVKDAEP